MRKICVSLAIAAVAVAWVSCGNGPKQKVDVPEVKLEQNTEEMEKAVPIDQQTEITSDKYTIKVPEGWKARSRMVNHSCILGLKQPPFTTATPNVIFYQNIEKYKDQQEGDGSTALDNITVNGHEFVVYENEGQDGTIFIGAATPLGEGIFQVTLQTGAHKLSQEAAEAAIIDNLNTILENVSFK